MFRAISVFCLTLVLAQSAGAVVLYQADALPGTEGWTLINYPAYEATPGVLTLSGGVLTLSDPLSSPGSAAHYYRDLAIDPAAQGIWAEWDMRAGYSNDGSFFALERNPGTPYDTAFELEAGSVGVFGNSPQVAVGDNTTDFHTYRAEIEGTDYRLFMDGAMLFNGTALTGFPGNTLRVHFGLGSSAGTAEFEVDEIRAGTLAVPAPANVLLLLLATFVAFSRRALRVR